MVKIKINKKEYEAEEGKKIIEICRERGIEIAAFCDHVDFASKEGEKGKEDAGVCRLCMVKAKRKEEDKESLVTACTLEAVEGLEVKTEDAEIAFLRKVNLELLFAEHAGVCAHCARNNDCELQELAEKYDIDEYRFAPRARDLGGEREMEFLSKKMAERVVDDKNPCIFRDSEKCIKCRRCIRVCRDFQTVEAYAVTGKGVETNVGTEYNTPLECTYCGQCTTVCPTAALVERSEIGKFLKAVSDPKKIVVVQTAPSVRVALGEEFGMAAGTLVTGKMVTALRKMGADLVFDTNLGADVTIMEESNELVGRIKGGGRSLPLFTSCCPAWVLFLERYYPQFLNNLSTCRSPQIMLGSLIKNYWAKKNGLKAENVFVTSIMPCIAKKYEKERSELSYQKIQNVDCVLTTRELGLMLRQRELNFAELEEGEFDPALGLATSAGAIFGASGGVMEAALRTAYYFVTDKNCEKVEFNKVRGEEGVRAANFQLENLKLRVKIVHGLGNARRVLEKMKRGEADFDFLEVMACPNGCIGGGGQPVPTSKAIREKRARAIYSQDDKMELRRSHENPLVKELYARFLIAPGSKKAEKYLHTKYHPYRFRRRD